jgi:uncharacterized membrane protein YtjA (UPF0391 family)
MAAAVRPIAKPRPRPQDVDTAKAFNSTGHSVQPGVHMLHYAVVFFVIALIAALFGFGGIAAGAAGIAKILFVVFIILAIASFLFGRSRGL